MNNQRILNIMGNLLEDAVKKMRNHSDDPDTLLSTISNWEAIAKMVIFECKFGIGDLDEIPLLGNYSDYMGVSAEHIFPYKHRLKERCADEVEDWFALL